MRTAPRADIADSGLPLKHQKVQRLRRLVSRRSARRVESAFVVEGPRVLAAALDADVAVESVFVAPGTDDPTVQRAHDAGARVFTLAAGVLERVADTVTPQPVMAIVPAVDVPLDRLRGQSLVLVCVDVRDPGNAGTLLRSAEAAGAGGVVCCDGSVDLFNPKTVRASAGSLFHVPVVAGGDPVEVLEAMATWGLRRCGARARGGTDYVEADLRQPLALVFGNEASGLPADLESMMDEHLTVPMAGRSESLNVGVAAAVICFEANRQRRSPR